MQAVGAAAGTRRALPAKTIRSNLNARLKTRISPQKQLQIPAGTPTDPHPTNLSPSLLHPRGAFINVTQPIAPAAVAPLLQKLIKDYALTGLPPAYLPKDEISPDLNPA